MFLKSIKKNGFILSFLVASTVSYAQPDVLRIPCPSLDALHQSASLIKDAEMDIYGNYSVYSSEIPEKSGRFSGSWVLIVNNVLAKSEEEAVNVGKKIATNITTQSNIFAYMIFLRGGPIMSICGFGENVFLLGGININFETLRLTLNKFNISQKAS